MRKVYNPMTNMIENESETKRMTDASPAAETFMKRFEAMREANFKIWRAGDKYKEKEQQVYESISKLCNGIDYELKKAISQLRNV